MSNFSQSKTAKVIDLDHYKLTGERKPPTENIVALSKMYLQGEITWSQYLDIAFSSPK